MDNKTWTSKSAYLKVQAAYPCTCKFWLCFPDNAHTKALTPKAKACLSYDNTQYMILFIT